MSATRLSIPEYAKGILAGDRVIIGKAISLVESDLPSDQKLASELVEKIFEKTGNAIRIGVSGAPGVGKSTFIEAFGEYITSLKKKIAVLTIDPTSRISGGSILGDKTRMENLSKNPLAIIRPTASGGILGGVSSKTREAMLICEAAGYEVIIIETVGVGQSEIEVKNMVDFFLLLMLAGAGDELQGIKKGIMEIADAVVITKADGDNVKQATQARAEYQQAVHLQRAHTPGWTTPVMICSALHKAGITEIWKMISSFKEKTSSSGEFQKKRNLQNISWFTDLFRQSLSRDYLQYDEVHSMMNEISSRIGEGKISPYQGAQQLLTAYHRAIQGSKS